MPGEPVESVVVGELDDGSRGVDGCVPLAGARVDGAIEVVGELHVVVGIVAVGIPDLLGQGGVVEFTEGVGGDLIALGFRTASVEIGDQFRDIREAVIDRDRGTVLIGVGSACCEVVFDGAGAAAGGATES